MTDSNRLREGMTVSDINTDAREEAIGLILAALDDPTAPGYRTRIAGGVDTLLDPEVFGRLAGLLGYVKAEGEEWGVRSPIGNVRPCVNEDVARIVNTNWTIVRRLVGPWEVA